jgi:uncharacterized phage protein (TIGR01671 family)
MREIKFRAWDDKKEIMIYDGDEVGTIDFHSGDHIDIFYIKMQSYDILRLYTNIMQYTGLKDKNGQEIYEGDIVKVSAPRKDDLIFRVVWDDSQAGFQMVIDEDEVTSYSFFCVPCEVIGNIYENPGLT